VSASEDLTLKIWHAAARDEIATLRGHSDFVTSAAYSPDGSRIVSGSDDQTLKVWNADKGVAVTTLRGHISSVTSCGYSPDGKLIVSGSFDGTLRVWNAETAGEIASVAGHQDFVCSCAFSPDGRFIVSASWDRTLKIWDAVNIVEIATLAGHSGLVNSCVYSPDGRYVVSGSEDMTIRIWNAATSAQVMCFFAGGSVGAVAAGKAAKTLATGDRGGNIYILRPVPQIVSVPLVTIVHLFRSDTHSFDPEPKARCEWCGRQFSPDPRVREAIRGITDRAGLAANESPCIGLAADCWADPALVSECPNCHGRLRFNPFIVDNRQSSP
jgi:WD40 repeat protein